MPPLTASLKLEVEVKFDVPIPTKSEKYDFPTTPNLKFVGFDVPFIVNAGVVSLVSKLALLADIEPVTFMFAAFTESEHTILPLVVKVPSLVSLNILLLFEYQLLNENVP